ncbi:LURP1-like domain protein [Kalmanozyma brasiliensis GHG001]|uniref:Phospholipid scramblase n=1 Tax=Kalmanozyma brasiliensis (strain GHG001) TaxID=1365824 RepID=V5F2K0_KALBG|nr:LURP1-like domain protein [Kalmanozyma brasiliensis GHG001]EST09644.1 LURP1-like domain protein [Kalmanozyma brasiliensis GHG001]
MSFTGKGRPTVPMSGPPPIIVPLPPPPYPMGIIAEYTRHTTPITLRVRELKWSHSGDDFKIKDAVIGALLFKVDAKVFSLSSKKILLDHTGRQLFEFCHVGFFTSSYQGESCDPSKKLLFTVDKIGYFNPKLEIVFDNLAGDGRRQRWTLRGRWLSGVAQITTDSGFIVASISRDYGSMGDIFFDKQTYDVTVAPGVDAAFVSALCVCLDEAYHDRRERY